VSVLQAARARLERAVPTRVLPSTGWTSHGGPQLSCKLQSKSGCWPGRWHLLALVERFSWPWWERFWQLVAFGLMGVAVGYELLTLLLHD
jgi:hypothetical protein